MRPILDIIIPTWNNLEMLSSCLNSIRITLGSPLVDMVRVIVVNNGNPVVKAKVDAIKDSRLLVLQAPENLGWEGGLNFGLSHSKAKFVAFCNDDIRLTPSNNGWFWKTMALFNDPAVGAVGPSSNFVMGPQNLFLDILMPIISVRYLIGFFMILRREALEKAGGVDESLPGGDDIDLSIRLRDAGYKLLARRDVFVYHHGQQTGARLHAGYWNSPKMQEKTNQALIKKHGMKKFYETMVLGGQMHDAYGMDSYTIDDVEGDLCRKHVEGEAVLEIGCGGRKTHEKSVGVDRFAKGTDIPLVTEGADSCLADLEADVSVSLPVPPKSQDTIIARHILEHCQDTLGTLSVWNRSLRSYGKLIVAVPNQELANTIVMNPEHVASFTPESLQNQASVCGFRPTAVYKDVNGVSFVAVFEKTGEPFFTINDPVPTRHPLAARELVGEAACA